MTKLFAGGRSNHPTDSVMARSAFLEFILICFRDRRFPPNSIQHEPIQVDLSTTVDYLLDFLKTSPPLNGILLAFHEFSYELGYFRLIPPQHFLRFSMDMDY